MLTVAHPQDKSVHQQRVEEFMRKAGQDLPSLPTAPTEEVRLLRAKLIFEECLETIQALGVYIRRAGREVGSICFEDIAFEIDRSFNGGINLALVADGCADIAVVTTGTLSACGIADAKLQEMVDNSNLAKFTTPQCLECGKEMVLVTNSLKQAPQKWVCKNGLPTHPHLDADAGGYKSDGTDGNTPGKWVKPKDWRAPDFQALLDEQTQEVVREEAEYKRRRDEEEKYEADTGAYGYACRLLKVYASQCNPLPDLFGVLTQIGNYIAGLREKAPGIIVRTKADGTWVEVFDSVGTHFVFQPANELGRFPGFGEKTIKNWLNDRWREYSTQRDVLNVEADKKAKESVEVKLTIGQAIAGKVYSLVKSTVDEPRDNQVTQIAELAKEIDEVFQQMQGDGR